MDSHFGLLTKLVKVNQFIEHNQMLTLIIVYLIGCRRAKKKKKTECFNKHGNKLVCDGKIVSKACSKLFI